MRLTVFLVACIILQAQGQLRDRFLFKRSIGGVTADGWYSINITPPIQEKLNDDLSDVRILGIQQNDTTEFPYVVRIHEDEVNEKELNVSVINKSKKDGKSYVTFELPAGEKINRIEFHFEEPDFDGYVKLEGSADQKEWFLISEGSRIVSLREPVDFQSTLVRFPQSSFRFVRAEVKANKELHFTSATVGRRETTAGSRTNIPVSMRSSFDKRNRQTTIAMTFPNEQQLSSLTVAVKNTEDYYRPFHAEVLEDSTKTSAGWQYYYREIFYGYLTSLDSNSFHFHPVKAKKLRLTISNADNEPLKIDAVKAEGPQVSLVARMRVGENFLFYSSSKVGAPHYDIGKFSERIPAILPEVVLGEEVSIARPTSPVSPLFEKKIWLWTVMGVVIALLGFFTTRMLRRGDSSAAG